jgi:hypothetical protein
MTTDTHSAARPRATTQPLPALAIGVATAIDLAAAGLLLAGPLCWAVGGLALALHIFATGSLLLGRRLRGSRRTMLLAFSLALPVVGAAAVILALAASGPETRRSELEIGLAHDDEEDDRAQAPTPAQIRAFGEALPAADALLVAGVEERRAMLWALGRRADADAVALLRWALTAAPNDLGLEAALALEDLSIGFEKRLDAHRKALAAAPDHDEAMAAGAWLTRGFEIGLVDVARMRKFAAEARQFYALARARRPEAAADVALAEARMEMAVLRPDKALDLLDAALAGAATPRHDELRRLRAEAALQSHDLPWEGPSLLATYRNELALRRATGGARARPVPMAAPLAKVQETG